MCTYFDEFEKNERNDLAHILTAQLTFSRANSYKSVVSIPAK